MSTKKKPRSDWRERDPEVARERSRYAHPLPSRAVILRALADHEGPCTAEELIALFGLTADDPLEGFERRLAAMVRDGQLARNRKGAYGPARQMHLIAGRVAMHRDGYGWLTPEAGGEDIFLPPREARQLLPGDKVLVRVSADARGRREGAVVDILERGTQSVVGRYVVEHGAGYVIPDNPRVLQDVLIPLDARGAAQPGQMVVAELTAPPGGRTLPVGRIVEVLGEHLAPGMEIEAAIRAHGLPHRWPEAAEREAAALPDAVRAQDCVGREDLRALPLVTIDGADARDFDDAVWCEPLHDGFRLIVAIADVAAYVRPGSALDKEAVERGNSVYFPERVIPMLPEKLSNGLCSLNPDVDRLCMACEMRVAADGAVTRARFIEGVMRSHARLTYDEVFAILENSRGPEAKARRALLPHLQALDAVFAALFAARERRGALDLDSVETRIVFSSGRKIERIVPVERNRAHRIIEECMIAANVQAAMRVERKKLPVLHRIHEPPEAEKVKTLREFLQPRGLRLAGGETPAPKDFARVLARARERDDARLLQSVILRTQMQARYSPANSGHFGLALEHYAHFTSPIRRYPDLLLHRALKHVLRRGPRREFGYTLENMEALGAHCSMTERRADDATRDAVAWLKCEYMRHRIGEEYDGLVTGVASFGLFVELDGVYVEGLVHVTALANDYYVHQPRQHRLVGERRGRAYALGQRMRVRVVRVNLDERKIDLEPVAPDRVEFKERDTAHPRQKKRTRR